ncbi:MAG: hypothetical protein E6H79_10405 [Betaproteobacteria bacterium]|nr:MAG: hypothetical protein E6H79_10405 [Betaproteobacteria bacterium]
MRILTLLRSRTASARVEPRALWTAADWARVRAPLRHRDAELSPKAKRWVSRLPKDAQPHALCAQYPRIANQLAACWTDIGLIEHLLESLMLDQRGGRHGFPRDVADDLALLYEYHAQRAELLSAIEGAEAAAPDAALRECPDPRS